MSGGDPVSWFLIEPGWTVLDVNGKEVGHVQRVEGDSGADIFNGLAVSVGLLKASRYVPAEAVTSITEGTVQLKLAHEQVGALPHHERPQPSERILPPDRRG